MTSERHLDWEGCWNLRDLGGPTIECNDVDAHLLGGGASVDDLAAVRTRLVGR